MNKLTEILNKYNINGFDKNGGTDKNTEHSYLDTYEKLFSPYINKEINLLEIGVANGGSALLWYEYLPKSKLYLIDIDDLINENIKNIFNIDRYSFYKMNAYKNTAIDKLKNDVPDGFDIIIDDGSHLILDQCIFIKKYLPLLKKDGILIIEDIQSVKDLNLIQSQVPSEFKDKIKIFDLRKNKNRYDDILFVIYS